MVSVAKLVYQKRFDNRKDQLFWFLCLVTFIFLFGSCSPKPEPTPVANVKSKKPNWVDGKSMDSDQWFGIGSVALGDSLDPKNMATESIKKKIYFKIEKDIKNEFNLSETVLKSICDQAIALRIDLIKNLIKDVDSYSDGISEYVLLSLNKNTYSEAIGKRLEESNIAQMLDRIKGPPGKENFLLLSKVINIIVGSIDLIINKDQQPKNSNADVLNKVQHILNDYNERCLFNYEPGYLNSIPISNDQKQLTIKVIDKITEKRIDSLHMYIDYGGEYDSETWVTGAAKDFNLLLPNSVSRSSYVITLSVDYEKIFGGNYLDLFSVKPNHKKITIIPKNIRFYSTESISTLGTGLEYSAVYDSIKSCFGENYSAEFVQNINDADLVMDIEVSTRENMRRKSRKHPFKSEAFFILSLKYRESGNNMFSHTIAKTEALDYDFVERASIRSLRDLSNKAIKSICQ